MTEQRYSREDHAQYRAQVEEERRREEAARREATKERVRAAWIKDGGTTSSFEAAWEMLEADRRRERLREAGEAARRAQAGTSRI